MNVIQNQRYFLKKDTFVCFPTTFVCYLLLDTRNHDRITTESTHKNNNRTECKNQKEFAESNT